MTTFQEFIQAKTPTHRETQRWSYHEGTLYDGETPFDPKSYTAIFKPIIVWFREWQKMAGIETQVLIVTNEDYQQYYTRFPILPVPSEELKIVILPQINTISNSIIDDAYWHKTVKGQPVMRIHSHHSFGAYQSTTDFRSLNSGTLELVFGHIERNEVAIAYWLTRHSDVTAKETVYETSIQMDA